MEFTGERLVPDEVRSDDLYHEHIVRYMFAAQFAPGRAVLDAGCGAGYGTALLAAGGAQRALGVDIAADAVAYARQHYQAAGLSFEEGDVCTLLLPESSFGLVVAFEVIEHLAEPARLVSAAARLLKPDGLFVVSTPNPATYPPGNPYHKHEMNAAQFEAVLGRSFASRAFFGQDYATAQSLRPWSLPAGSPSGSWEFVAARDKPATEPDYFLALCARDDSVLAAALLAARAIMYELPADRLGERIADDLRLQAALDEKNLHLAEKDVHIAALQEEMKRQSTWARGLEEQLLQLRGMWYVRLFGRRRR